jgi:hypothetical protein
LTVLLTLDRLGHVLPIGGRLVDMIRLERFTADPDTHPGAKGTDLAAMHADHHTEVTADEYEPVGPKLGPPVYFIRQRGSGNVKLWPRCDGTYWFRATFREPVKFGAPPKAEE